MKRYEMTLKEILAFIIGMIIMLISFPIGVFKQKECTRSQEYKEIEQRLDSIDMSQADISQSLQNCLDKK